jgi:ATP synthase F1 delta subunit
VLHERRDRIEEGLRNADRIKQELADAEKRHAEILSKANGEAQKMIDEARESAGLVASRKEQEAIAAAEQIIAKAREASVLEHERTMEQLKRELGRLVVDTTAKVTGKVLNTDDQRRLRELLRASFTDGQLDQGKVGTLVQSLITKKPRNYLATLEYYKRLLRLELEKRHARIESATELPPEAREQITANLQRRYGQDVTTEFAVEPTLLGGMRIRVGSDVWDGTVKSRLERLASQL